MAVYACATIILAAALRLAAADGPVTAVPGQSGLPGAGAGINIDQLTTSGAFSDLNALFALGSQDKVNIHQNTLSEAGGLLNLQNLDRSKPVAINQDTTSTAFSNSNAIFNPVPPGVKGAPVDITQDTTAVATGLISSTFALPKPGTPQSPVSVSQNVNAVAAGQINAVLGANSGPVSIKQTATAIAQGSNVEGSPASDQKSAGAPPQSGRKLLLVN